MANDTPHGIKAKIRRANFSYFLEEKFTSWALHAIFDSVGLAEDGEGSLTWETGPCDEIAIRNNGEVMWYDNTTEVGPPEQVKKLYIISPAAVLLATLDSDLSISDLQRIRTLTDKYFLFPKYTGMNCDKLVVQEGIALLWEHEVTGTITDPITGTKYTVDDSPLDGGMITISTSGKWIAAIVKEDTSGDALVFIYKAVNW